MSLSPTERAQPETRLGWAPTKNSTPIIGLGFGLQPTQLAMVNQLWFLSCKMDLYLWANTSYITHPIERKIWPRWRWVQVLTRIFLLFFLMGKLYYYDDYYYCSNLVSSTITWQPLTSWARVLEGRTLLICRL